jgi:hypothetical protein
MSPLDEAPLGFSSFNPECILFQFIAYKSLGLLEFFPFVEQLLKLVLFVLFNCFEVFTSHLNGYISSGSPES